MSHPQLQAQKRSLFGRKVKRLRKDNLLPANIFGKNVKSQSIQLNLKNFSQIYDQVGETGLVDLSVDKKTTPVLVTNVQLNPVTSAPLHVDFRQVDLTQKVTANIPLEITGESPAVKEKGGVLVTPQSEIEIEALPTNLPDKFTLDIGSLKEIGNSLTIADLKVDSKVEIKLSKDTPLALIQEPKKEEEPEPTPAEAVEGGDEEGTEKKEAGEGEASKEAKSDEKDKANKSSDSSAKALSADKAGSAKAGQKPQEKSGGD